MLGRGLKRSSVGGIDLEGLVPKQSPCWELSTYKSAICPVFALPACSRVFSKPGLDLGQRVRRATGQGLSVVEHADGAVIPLDSALRHCNSAVGGRAFDNEGDHFKSPSALRICQGVFPAASTI